MQLFTSHLPFTIAGTLETFRLVAPTSLQGKTLGTRLLVARLQGSFDFPKYDISESHQETLLKSLRGFKKAILFVTSLN